MENNHGVPILGSQKPRIGVSQTAFVRHLDETGTYESDIIVQGPDGKLIPIAQRQDYLDATELLNAIRLIVREEIAKAVTSQRLNRSMLRGK